MRAQLFKTNPRNVQNQIGVRGKRVFFTASLDVMRNTRTVVLRSLLAVTVPVGTAAYLLISSPEGIVVSTEGEVQGIFNMARSQLQAGDFWEQQLAEARRNLESKRSAPEREANRKARFDLLTEKTRKQMEVMYERNPKLRPSPATTEAERLRDAADDIEQAELDQHLESRRQSRMIELEKIIRAIESKNLQALGVKLQLKF